MRRRHWLAIGVWVATMTASLIALAILGATRDTVVPSSWGFRGASEAFALTCGTVGVIVAIRRPDNLNGWLFCAIGALFALQALINEYVIAGALVVPGGLPATTFLGWTLSWVWVLPLSIALIYLPLLFPTGSLVSRGWRAVAWLGVIGIVLFGIALAFAPGPIQQASFITNPFGATGIDMKTYAAIVFGPASFVFITAIVLALSSLVVRFRHASGDARQQIKWFALATMIAGATFGVYLVLFASVGTSGIKAAEVLVIVTLMGVPTAAGMAILRYRLYDIDRIVSRTISYGVITACWSPSSSSRQPGTAGRVELHHVEQRLGGRWLDPARRRAVHAGPPARPARRGPALRSRPLRRGSADHRVRRSPPRRGRPVDARGRARRDGPPGLRALERRPLAAGGPVEKVVVGRDLGAITRRRDESAVRPTDRNVSGTPTQQHEDRDE